MKNSFGCRTPLQVGSRSFQIANLHELHRGGHDVERLPFALKVLLENLLRREDGVVVPAADIESLLAWQPKAAPDTEIAFMPARVLLQDFTGVPAVADLAAMRDAMSAMGGDPGRINPLQPVELVIDHSVQVDEYGKEAALLLNAKYEFERNEERYLFLRWGQSAFENFRVVPPATGIVHQVKLEYLARGVMVEEVGGARFALPDTLVGTDSHTTMINGLGVLGWGVGGIEAEAAMLGQPISMLIPQVVGFRMVGRLPEGSTATDLVLRVTQMLRAKGVVGKFVEFFGPGLAGLGLADRATIANMAPEYGATCGIFPVDQLSIDYLRFTGRDEDLVALVEAYYKEQGMFHTASSKEAEYSDVLELDLGTVVPALAGPKRPQDRIDQPEMKQAFLSAVDGLRGASSKKGGLSVVQGEPGDGVAVAEAPPLTLFGEEFELEDGAVVIAAITSCTNTSNPSVMLAAGLLAKKAVERGLRTKPWVKTSLAPGSKVVTSYLEQAGLMDDLEALRFHLVGYGCTTCIGNSGPLHPDISAAIHENNLVACSVLSGNRNFEGRISGDVRANYLASPPLVVAYALAGRVDIDMMTEPLGEDADGQPVYLRDLWPSQEEITATLRSALRAEMFREQYADVFTGDERWRALDIPEGETFAWGDESTYVKQPPFFTDIPRQPEPVEDLEGALVLALLGDSVTTDHISPAGSITTDSPAGKYLVSHGVAPRDFNSYGSRRGNHEVMMRGTFANVRLRNRLVDVEGGHTLHLPTGQQMTIYDAAMLYQQEGTPLVVLAGKEYGTGSSRDWAAKGSILLGIRAVIAESFERIHRSNLIGMGVAPIEFEKGSSVQSLGLTGHERYSVRGIEATFDGGFTARSEVTIEATSEDGEVKRFPGVLRLDTPQEGLYYRHGGILQYVLRQLLDDEGQS
ncbi:MAG: aconitate hydratase AcnA [Acidobacteria bacterium]|nr:MAG: aconitate hydratase AcnA [Acidobacteriota bacterium]